MRGWSAEGVGSVSVMGLAAWLLTAGLGGYLATVWLRHGGLQQRRAGVTRLPLWLVTGHALLALTGLTAWVAFLLSRTPSSAWAASAIVLLAASLGFMMLFRWLPSRGRHAHTEHAAERHFPLAAVVAHGMCAAMTILLVLLATVREL